MRHEYHLLSEEASRSVIEEVNAWCRRTGTNYNKLVTAARVAVSTRSAVRRRCRRLTILTAARLREAMRVNPQGITKGDHKARLVRARIVLGQQLIVAAAAAPRPVDNSTCYRCGVRRLAGCEHFPVDFESRAYA